MRAVSSVRSAKRSSRRTTALGGASAGISIYSAGYFRQGEGTPPGVHCVLYQVFGRYILNDTPTWAEALALVGDGSGLDDHPRLVEELDVLLAPEDEEFLLKS